MRCTHSTAFRRPLISCRPGSSTLSRAKAGRYHPPVVRATLKQVDAARQVPGHDAGLLAEVDAWVHERLPLFTDDASALVHGDLHGSNVMVDRGRVTGLVDFAEALAQPADAELDTILRWCARPDEFPATPDAQGLDRSGLSEVPQWLYRSYPELFEREHLRDRLLFYDMFVELAIAAHHPQPGIRETAAARIARLLSGHNHLDGLVLPIQ